MNDLPETQALTVLIESPVKGDYARNLRYLHAAMRDCLNRGEAPFSSFELYRKVLDDKDAAERELGLARSFAIGRRMDTVAVYEDLGISDGMQRDIHLWLSLGMQVNYRKIGLAWDFGPAVDRDAKYTCRGCSKFETSKGSLEMWCCATPPGESAREIPVHFRMGGVPSFCPAPRGTKIE